MPTIERINTQAREQTHAEFESGFDFWKQTDVLPQMTLCVSILKNIAAELTKDDPLKYVFLGLCFLQKQDVCTAASCFVKGFANSKTHKSKIYRELADIAELDYEKDLAKETNSLNRAYVKKLITQLLVDRHHVITAKATNRFENEFEYWKTTGERKSQKFSFIIVREQLESLNEQGALRACFLADYLFESNHIREAATCLVYAFDSDRLLFERVCQTLDRSFPNMLGTKLKSTMQLQCAKQRLTQVLQAEYDAISNHLHEQRQQPQQ